MSCEVVLEDAELSEVLVDRSIPPHRSAGHQWTGPFVATSHRNYDRIGPNRSRVAYAGGML